MKVPLTVGSWLNEARWLSETTFREVVRGVADAALAPEREDRAVEAVDAYSVRSASMGSRREARRAG